MEAMRDIFATQVQHYQQQALTLIDQLHHINVLILRLEAVAQTMRAASDIFSAHHPEITVTFEQEDFVHQSLMEASELSSQVEHQLDDTLSKQYMSLVDLDILNNMIANDGNATSEVIRCLEDWIDHTRACQAVWARSGDSIQEQAELRLQYLQAFLHSARHL